MNIETSAVAEVLRDAGVMRGGKLVYRDEHLAIVAVNKGSEYRIIIEKVPETKKLVSYYVSTSSPMQRFGFVDEVQQSDTHYLVRLSGLGKKNKGVSERACLLSLVTQVLAEDGIKIPTMLREILVSQNLSTRNREFQGAGDSRPLNEKTVGLLEKVVYASTVKHNIGLVSNPMFFHGESDGNVLLLGWPSRTEFKVPSYLDDFVRQAFVRLTIDAIHAATTIHPDGKRINENLKSKSQGRDTTLYGKEEDAFYVWPPGAASPNSRFAVDVVPVRKGGTRTQVEVLDGESGQRIGIYDMSLLDSLSMGYNIIDDVMAHYQTFGAEKFQDAPDEFDIPDTVGRPDEDIDYGFDESDDDEFLDHDSLDNLTYRP